MRKYLLLSLLKALTASKQKYRRYPTDDIFVYDRAGHEIYRERKYQRKPSLFRYAKYAAVLGIFFVFVVGGLLIWGAVSAVNYAGDLLREQRPAATALVQQEWASQQDLVRSAETRLEQGKAKASQVLSQPITTQACLNKIQGALNPSTWLTVPLAAQWKNLREACGDKS